MVRTVEIPLATQFAQSKAKQFSSEKIVNMYAETNSKKKVNLYGRSGLTLFSDIGSRPVYALHEWKENVYAIVGNNLYKIDATGGSIDLGTIGTVNQPIQIFDNPNELIILNNQNGATFTYDSVNGLRQVDDSDFRNPTTGTFLDGYAIFSERDTDVFFISDIDDARSYSALDFASAEASSDKLVRVFGTLKYLWCFGERTIEVFQNTGASSFPFRNVAGTNYQQGCAAPLSVAQTENVLFWLNADNSVWSFVGSPRKISTYDIEARINSFDRTDNAIGFGFTEAGHDYYCINFPNNGTFLYDLSEAKWYEWKTFEQNYWTINCHVWAFGKNIVGDATTGKLYYLDSSNYTDNGKTMVSEVVTPNLFNDTNTVFIDRLEARWESGVGLLEGQGSDPQVMLQRSLDGGVTFSKEIWRKISKRGEYNINKTIWHNLGAGDNVSFKIKISDPVKRNLMGLYATVRAGGVDDR